MYTYRDNGGILFMSKEDILSLVVYLIMMAIALTVGFVILQPIISGGKLGDNGSVFCFLILSVIIGLIVNALIVEIGHIIGAIIGKYEILSINILSFAFFKKKEEGKIVNSFKFPKNYDGLTGETVISPKSEKSKPMSYVFGPLVLFLIELLGSICAFMYIKDSNGESILNFVKYGIFLSTCIGGMIIVYDYFPSRLDNLNDGYRLVLLNKKINIEAFNELLRIQKCDYFQEEAGEIKQFENITDFTAQVNMFSSRKYMNDEPEESLKIINKILENEKNVSKATLLSIKINKAYIYFLNASLDEAVKIYNTLFNDEERKTINSCYNLECTIIYLLYEGLVEHSSSEVEYAKERFFKLTKRSATKEHYFEQQLFDKALDFIKTNGNLKEVNNEKSE